MPYYTRMYQLGDRPEEIMGFHSGSRRTATLKFRHIEQSTMDPKYFGGSIQELSTEEWLDFKDRSDPSPSMIGVRVIDL